MAKVSAGAEHGCLVTVGGQLVAFGANESGQCGVPLPETVSKKLQQLDELGGRRALFMSKENQVSLKIDPCPEGHTMTRKQCIICVTCLECTGFGAGCCYHKQNRSANKAGGSLCGCGSGDAGCSKCMQCAKCCAFKPPSMPDNALRQLLKSTQIPVQAVPFPSAVIVQQVACGDRHTLAVDATGAVWTFGLNLDGQLGYNGCEASFSPDILALAHPATDVAAGAAHSLVLLSNGDVVSFGSNTAFQLCRVATDLEPAWKPLPVTARKDMRCVSVAANGNRSIFYYSDSSSSVGASPSLVFAQHGGSLSVLTQARSENDDKYDTDVITFDARADVPRSPPKELKIVKKQRGAC